MEKITEMTRTVALRHRADDERRKESEQKNMCRLSHRSGSMERSAERAARAEIEVGMGEEEDFCCFFVLFLEVKGMREHERTRKQEGKRHTPIAAMAA